MWGLSGACLPEGKAVKRYNRAEELNGLDAWRTIVRVIDNGLQQRLEDLRDEVRVIHTKRIKDLETVAIGVADFEKLLSEYVLAGGPGYDGDDIWKSDLRRILPQKLREDHTILNLDPKISYAAFRGHVSAQTRTLIHLRRQAGGLQGAVEPRPADMPELVGAAYDDDTTLDQVIAAVNQRGGTDDELLAAIGRWQQKRQGGQQRQQPQRQPQQRQGQAGAAGAGVTRQPRKCANCGQTHAEGVRQCPHPEVAREARKCWTCGKPVSHTHLRAHETGRNLVCRLLLEK